MLDNDRISENDILASALHYLSLEFSVIPVGKDKKPFFNGKLFDWKKYQTEKPTEEEIRKWFSDPNVVGIGLPTGKLNGFIALDIEAGADTSGLYLPPTVCQKTGGGGWHYLYKYPKFEVRSQKLSRTKMEIRGEGAYIVVSPSLHLSGNYYEWAVGLEDADFSEIPKWLSEEVEQKRFIKKDWEKITKGVNKGEGRNINATAIIGKILHYLPQNDWQSIGWNALRGLNQLNIPPLSEKELRGIFKSITSKELSNEVEDKLKQEKFIPLSFSELMLKEFENTVWTVEKLVPSQGITAISGAPAAYKTWFTLDMALKIASGDILFDKFTTEKSGVLFIDEENGERLLQQRFKKLNKNFELPIYFLSLMGFQLSKDMVSNIIKIAKEKDIKVIIFDSLVRIHGADENDATKMAGVFKHIKELNKEGLTVIFTHHNRKQGFFKGSPSQNMRGSSDILASVDCHLALEKRQKEEFITINQTKLRQEQEIKPFKLGIISDENSFSFEYFGDVDEIQTKKGDCKEAIKEILEREAKPMYKKELFDSLRNGGLEIGYSTFKITTKEMLEAEEIFEKRGEKNKIFCSLEPFNKTESIMG